MPSDLHSLATLQAAARTHMAGLLSQHVGKTIDQEASPGNTLWITCLICVDN